MADANARIAIKEEIEAAAARKKAAKDKLDEQNDVGDDACDDLQAGIESAWVSLETAVQSARSRFA